MGGRAGRVLTAGCAALLAVALVAGVPAPAWAHSTLVRSDPAKGATVSVPVSTITLTFNEMVKQSKTVITVIGANGVNYADGAAKVVDKDVKQAVRPLPKGAVTVSWKSASADGDAISGTFAFTNTVAPASAPPPPTAVATSAPAGAPATSAALTEPAAGEQGSTTVLWWIVGAVVLLLLAAGGAWLWSQRQRRNADG